jgi:uncharacterized cupin superfamily protein
MRVKVNFPFYAATGNQSSAVVYFEIEPGHYLGTNTDSAEEILVILDGTVEASIAEERDQVTAGQSALVPAMVPHGVRNAGTQTARCTRAAGIDAKRISPHRLRHTSAIRSLRSRHDVIAVQKPLEHASVATTQRYLDHLDLAELRRGGVAGREDGAVRVSITSPPSRIAVA